MAAWFWKECSQSSIKTRQTRSSRAKRREAVSWRRLPALREASASNKIAVSPMLPQGPACLQQTRCRQTFVLIGGDLRMMTHDRRHACQA